MNSDAHALTVAELVFFQLDMAGNVVFWSRAAGELFGPSGADTIGHPLTTLIGQPLNSVGKLTFEAAMRNGRAETFGWAPRKDGSRFWANLVFTPIHDDAGHTTGFTGLLRDATLWKEAQDERERIFTLSRDLLCVAGFDGFFKRVNPSFTRVLGYSETEILGKPYTSFVHPDDVAATEEETRSLASGTATLIFRNRYRCADNTYRWLEWSSTPFPEEQLIYAVARDVTDHKATEQKLQEQYRELERSNKDLQEFAYVASHDLQEPLRAVAGCVQMLGERNAGKLDERSLELMGYAIDGAKRLQTLINDLLAYSRVGSKGILKAFANTTQAADQAVVQLSAAINESDALVKVDPLPQVWVDVKQMTQLFQNLIGNALKFRAEQRPEIHVSAEQRAGESVFTVRDNGIGIAPEYHEKVFGVFQRLNSRREYSGTGIGLAICKKIVERHGGRIWIESRAGEGTAFRFSIPDDTTSL